MAPDYPTAALETTLGLLGLLLFILGVIGLAAGVTLAVVKLLPAREPARENGES